MKSMETVALLSVLLVLGRETRAVEAVQQGQLSPASVLGTYFGQGDGHSDTNTDGRHCRITSQKHVTIEIGAEGTVHWTGYHYFDIDCDDLPSTTMPRSCWTKGTGRLASGKKKGWYTLTTSEATITAAPAVYQSGLMRWKCGRVEFDLPDAIEPVGAGCVKVGRTELPYMDQVAGGACQMGRDFAELDEASLQIEGDRAKITLNLPRPRRIEFRKTSGRSSAVLSASDVGSQAVEQATGDGCPPGTVKSSKDYDNFQERVTWREEYCRDRDFEKHGPSLLKRSDGTKEKRMFNHGLRHGKWLSFNAKEERPCGYALYDRDELLRAWNTCEINKRFVAFRNDEDALVRLWLGPSNEVTAEELTGRNGKRLQATGHVFSDIPTSVMIPADEVAP